MRTKCALSLFALVLTSYSCGNTHNESGYNFSVGQNFSNEKLEYKHTFFPNFEDEFEKQPSETIYFTDEIDFSNFEGGEVIKINKPGTYRLKGTSQNSSLLVDTLGDVTLYLDNLTLSCQTCSPLKIVNAQSVTIKLPSRTKSFLTDSLKNCSAGVIHSEVPLKIEGNGFLYLTGYGSNYEIGNYGHAIFSKSDLDIYDSRIIVDFSVNDAFKSLGKMTIKNSKIDVSFSLSTGLFASEEIDIYKSLYLYSGMDTSIFSNKNITFDDSSLYIDTYGTFEVIKDTDNLDFSRPIFYRNGEDYNRLDEEDYKNKATLYHLLNNAIGIYSKSDIEFIDSYIEINSDNSSIYSEKNITSLNSEFSINSSNYGFYAEDSLSILGEKSDDFSFFNRIYDCYQGLVGNKVEIESSSAYIYSTNAGIMNNKKDLDTNISLKNNTLVHLDSKKYGINALKDFNLDSSNLVVFGSSRANLEPINFNDSINVFDSFLLTLEEMPQDPFLTSTDQPYIRTALKESLQKNSVLSVCSDNFNASIISTRSYLNPSLTLSSPKMEDETYEVIKNGLIDYPFYNNVSIKKGKPIDGLLVDTIII